MGLEYFESRNSTLDFQKSLVCGMLIRAYQKMKGGGEKGNYFPLLKVLMKMKSILLSDLICLNLGNTGRNRVF